MLTTHHLDIVLANKTLLDDINITIKTGKIYGLIGHNGSGKSTLIKSLSGEMRASSGQICLENKPINQIPKKALAQRLAYLPQKLPDQAGFSVYELVMLGRYPHQHFLQKPSDNDKKIVMESLSKTNIQAFANNALSDLSGGERTRAWLAMCLAQTPDYLLLDEPLAPLDIVYQVQILQLLQSLAHQFGLAVLIIIHDINLAARFCDEIIALKNGKLCYAGGATDVMNKKTLKQIFDIDLHLYPHPITSQTMAVV